MMPTAFRIGFKYQRNISEFYDKRTGKSQRILCLQMIGDKIKAISNIIPHSLIGGKMWICWTTNSITIDSRTTTIRVEKAVLYDIKYWSTWHIVLSYKSLNQTKSYNSVLPTILFLKLLLTHQNLLSTLFYATYITRLL